MSSREILESGGPALENAWFIEGATSAQFFKAFLDKHSDSSGVWQAAASYDLAKILSKLASANVEPSQFIAKSLGTCLENSGFDKDCVKQENGVAYLDVPLAVTTIKNSEFVRAG